MPGIEYILMAVFGVLIGAAIIAGIISRFLVTVPAGVIRIISWYGGGGVKIFKGPGKAFEVPLLTTPALIPSQAINIDLDITDQTSDRDAQGVPRPIKVNVQASAIVAVGDTDEMILTAANRFFSKSGAEQMGTLTDLLTSSGRRAINLLKHDQLFSATAAQTPEAAAIVAAQAVQAAAAAALLPMSSRPVMDDEDEDPLAIIIKRQCSRELHDLGLTFKSLNIKAVTSEVAEARRRQSAVEAKANADIVQAEQERRAQEARLQAAQQISDKERELERRRAENAAQVAQAEALKQDALAVLRAAELRATQIAQATADAERAKVEAMGKAEAEKARLITVAEGEAQRARVMALGEAEAQRLRLVTTAHGEAERARVIAEGESTAQRMRLETVAAGEAERTRLLAIAQAEAIERVNDAIAKGGDSYLRIKQLELLPQIVPHIAAALAQARIVNFSGSGDAAQGTLKEITSVLQTVLTAQLLKEGLDGAPQVTPAGGNGAPLPVRGSQP